MGKKKLLRHKLTKKTHEQNLFEHPQTQARRTHGPSTKKTQKIRPSVSTEHIHRTQTQLNKT